MRIVEKRESGDEGGERVGMERVRVGGGRERRRKKRKGKVQRDCRKGEKGWGERSDDWDWREREEGSSKEGEGEGGLGSRNTLSLFSWVVQPLGPEIS